MVSDGNWVYLLLGSNLGDREKIMHQALKQLAEKVGEPVLLSSLYETAAWGKTDQPAFLNCAVKIQTVLSPLSLLESVLSIETALGRTRHEKWGARIIDIDIIFYGEAVIDIPGRLQIPHPQMQHRKFVLQPLAEIEPCFMHPVLHKSIQELLDTLSDELPVIKYENRPVKNNG